MPNLIIDFAQDFTCVRSHNLDDVYQRYNHSADTQLEDVYGRYSDKKARAYAYCRNIDVSQSDISLYAWLAFKQDVWMTKDIANDIAKQLKPKYPYRYSRASLCIGNWRCTV